MVAAVAAVHSKRQPTPALFSPQKHRASKARKNVMAVAQAVMKVMAQELGERARMRWPALIDDELGETLFGGLSAKPLKSCRAAAPHTLSGEVGTWTPSKPKLAVLMLKAFASGDELLSSDEQPIVLDAPMSLRTDQHCKCVALSKLLARRAVEWVKCHHRDAIEASGEIPEDQLPFLGYSSWQVNTFYICSTLSMCFSLFNLTVTSFCLVLAQGLSLRGPPGSQARAVAIFVKQWDAIRFVLAVSLMTIVIAALSIAWMKLEDEAHAMKITPIFITFIVVGTFVKMAAKLAQMAEQMEVTAQDLVGGDVNVNIPGVNDDNQLDLVMEEAERIDAAKT